jgi:hypothetical protein
MVTLLNGTSLENPRNWPVGNPGNGSNRLGMVPTDVVAVYAPSPVANVLMSMPNATSGLSNSNVIVSLGSKKLLGVRPSVFEPLDGRNPLVAVALPELEL